MFFLNEIPKIKIKQGNEKKKIEKKNEKKSKNLDVT